MTNEIRIIRHETTGSVLSVYRAQQHLGLVYLPLNGSTVFQATPTNERPSLSCDTETAAIAYLSA